MLKAIGHNAAGCLYDGDRPFAEQLAHLIGLVHEDMDTATGRRYKALESVERHLVEAEEASGVFEQ